MELCLLRWRHLLLLLLMRHEERLRLEVSLEMRMRLLGSRRWRRGMKAGADRTRV